MARSNNHFMRLNNKKSKERFRTGVSLEPEVTEYLDDLARRMGMNRSWVLNTIVHEYAKVMEQKNLMPLWSREALIHI
jgi:metal-responsive CopG/Arc/MetJ family transcriptional regulator